MREGFKSVVLVYRRPVRISAMSDRPPTEPASPWRQLFEEVRTATGNQRDEHGTLGSINWLRRQMELRNANPNVVRNIIYRDKGKLEDKRALFGILNELWQSTGKPALHSPELEALLSPAAGVESEVMQLLGREKMQAYRRFVSGVRSGAAPRLLLTGKPGSGKTLLTDTIQQALSTMPELSGRILRLEFNSTDLVSSLARMARLLGVEHSALETRLIRVGASGAFAVQADAQADVARVLFEAVRLHHEKLVILLHISQHVAATDELAGVPLRLNTPEVPRVRAGEWLWHSLIEPLSRLNGLSLLVSLTEAPPRRNGPGITDTFGTPVKLNPPTVNEARRFVRARLPQLGASQQEALVQRSGRSFEELRTLTLLAELREPLPNLGSLAPHLEQLVRLMDTATDPALREFLRALAVIAPAEFPYFPAGLLNALRENDTAAPGGLELAFLDPVPARAGHYRPFSRQLARSLRRHLRQHNAEEFRRLNRLAADWYREKATSEARSEEATRYIHHLFEARDWQELDAWMRTGSVPQSLLQQIWAAARQELEPGSVLDGIALRVATHYVKLGSYNHPDVLEALEPLAHSDNATVRTWTALKRAEGAALRGQFEHAENLLAGWEVTDSPLLTAEAAVVRAGIARWRGQLEEAARLVGEVARPLLPQIVQDGANGRLLHAKVAISAGLVAKDQGNMEQALTEFTSVSPGDDLIEARVAYHLGDVLLRLGRYDAALQQLDTAVELARRSEALISEQTRFMSRRGMLHGLLGDPVRAEEDFAAARAILVQESLEGSRLLSELPGGLLERDFWLARSNEDHALVLLASGQFQKAIFLLTENLRIFTLYGRTFSVDTGSRVRRSTLYLALAYWCRGTLQPFRFPFSRSITEAVDAADIAHSRRLLAQLQAEPTTTDRLLRRDCLLLASLLAETPECSARHAQQALELASSPFDRAQCNAYLALALLRTDDLQAALERVDSVERELAGLARENERSDRSLRAWACDLRIRASIGLGQVAAATRTLQDALSSSDLAGFHEQLITTFGDAVEGHAGGSRLPEEVIPGSTLKLELHGEIRLPDALLANWRAVNRAA